VEWSNGFNPKFKYFNDNGAMRFGWSNEAEVADNFNLLASATSVSNCQNLKSHGCELLCDTDS